MPAAILSLSRERELRSATWDGLWLIYKRARLDHDAMDQEFQRDGEWRNPDHEQIAADADELLSDISREARRRIEHLIGPALTFDDLQRML